MTQTNGEKGIHPQAQVEEETGRVIQTKVKKDYSSTSSHVEETGRVIQTKVKKKALFIHQLTLGGDREGEIREKKVVILQSEGEK